MTSVFGVTIQSQLDAKANIVDLDTSGYQQLLDAKVNSIDLYATGYNYIWHPTSAVDKDSSPTNSGYDASKVCDSDNNTYWNPNTGLNYYNLTLSFATSHDFHSLQLNVPYFLGPRSTIYDVTFYTDNTWTTQICNIGLPAINGSSDVRVGTLIGTTIWQSTITFPHVQTVGGSNQVYISFHTFGALIQRSIQLSELIFSEGPDAIKTTILSAGALGTTSTGTITSQPVTTTGGASSLVKTDGSSVCNLTGVAVTGNLTQTGSTSISTGNNGIVCNGALSMTGKLSGYNSISTVGLGLPILIYESSATGITAGSGNIIFTAPVTGGHYLFIPILYVTSYTSGSIGANISYTSFGTSTVMTGGIIGLILNSSGTAGSIAGLGQINYYPIPLAVAPLTNITMWTAGTFNLTYSYYFRLYRLF